jgi:integrase/recombinase XerD
MTPSQKNTKGIRFLTNRNKWQVRIKIAGRIYSKAFSLLEEAQEWRSQTEAKCKAQKSSAQVVDPGRLCSDLFKDWLADPLAFNSPETHAKAEKIARHHFEPVFRERCVGQICPQDVLEFARSLLTVPIAGSKGKLRNPKTVKNVIGTLGTFFEWCAMRTFIEHNPATDHKMRQQLKRFIRASRPRDCLANSIRKKARTPEEMKKLLAVTSRSFPEDAVAIEFFLHTGVRLGEAAALLWSDIVYVDLIGRPLERPMIQINKTMCFQTQQVKLGAKCNSNGQVELNSRMVSLLAEWGTHCERVGYGVGPHDSLLPQVAKSPSAFSQRITRHGKRAGIRHISPHSFRHTSITFQVTQGAALEQVQKVARHSTYNMTAAYFDATQLEARGVTELVAVALGSGSVSVQECKTHTKQEQNLRLIR